MKQMYLHHSSCGRLPPIHRDYDRKFKPTAAYHATLPDMMDVTHEAIKGVHVPVQQVGIHNFKLPLKYRTKAGKILTIETSVTGTVSLKAELKGINMSRIMLYKKFDADNRIADFRISCSHLESLHSHDAVSVICKGVKGGFTADFMDFGSLLY